MTTDSAPLPIEQIGPDLHRYVARVLAESLGLSLDADLERWCREAMAMPGRTTYAVFDGWDIVAVASMMVEGDSAYLSGSATLPRWQGRGIHAGLVARRVEDAARLGVHDVHAEAEAGEPEIGP